MRQHVLHPRVTVPDAHQHCSPLLRPLVIARKRLRVPQRTIAAAAGKSRQCINQAEIGRHHPTLQWCEEYAQRLDQVARTSAACSWLPVEFVEKVLREARAEFNSLAYGSGVAK